MITVLLLRMRMVHWKVPRLGRWKVLGKRGSIVITVMLGVRMKVQMRRVKVSR